MTGTAAGGGAPKGVEPKLLYHVRNLLLNHQSRSTRPPSEDSLCELLLSNHREYQRKQQGPLKKQVARALRWCLENDGSARAGSAGTGPQMEGVAVQVEERDHRKRAWDEAAEEAEHEADARQREEHQAGLNLLNNSMAAHYKRAQEEQQQQQSSSHPTHTDPTCSSAPSTEGAAAAVATSGPKKRRRARDGSVKLQGGGGGRWPATDGVEGPGAGWGSLPLATTSALPVVVERPTARYGDLAGIEGVLKDVRELIEYPLRHPEVYVHLGVEPPRGILLHGPPGSGKTLLANAIAGECGVAFLKVSAPEVVSGMSGESEQRVRELFQTAVEVAPSIVFIDEVDAITQKRETSQRGMERRIVAQLLTCLDSLSMEHTKGKPVLVVGATNRPDSLDPALRRAGRFDREISLGVPDQAARQRILQVLTSKMRLSGDMDLELIAKKTPGYVGADLASLTQEAAAVAISRIFESIHPGLAFRESQPKAEETSHEANEPTTNGLMGDALASVHVTMEDFLKAVTKVQPSSKREGFAAVPDVTWADVGALVSVREELAMSIIEPIACPESFQALGLTVPAGVLLFGPPGCGKTLLAKAIANESGANFISVKGPELLDKYVGESERAVRQVFTRARASSPCIIFFDELDALCPRRGAGGESGGGVSERVVNQLLTEMDGLEGRRNVFVIAATNRPELIDPAMLRPGRLDKLLYVPLPTREDRISILRALCRKVTLRQDGRAEDMIEAIGADPRAEGYSGADLAALVREAGLSVLRALRRARTQGSTEASALQPKLAIGQEHFEEAFEKVAPSVSARDQKRYLQLRASMSCARASAAPTTTGGNGQAAADKSQAEPVSGVCKDRAPS